MAVVVAVAVAVADGRIKTLRVHDLLREIDFVAFCSRHITISAATFIISAAT
ncbi:uncharacterized protein HKW66_Vig0162400 [Vigna angularis]|uniref:Uncharacterized protein n=1 Tax=Phaseolus angularis TaxID=3914 RepID=A0A8T0JLR7_PHAAN|nr:uncharacterized protein HKW66_Vig0162400 [Vigna angularis]